MGKKFVPKSKIELRKLILNEDIELADIDTSRITDMSHLFEPTMRGGDQARFFGSVQINVGSTILYSI